MIMTVVVVLLLGIGVYASYLACNNLRNLRKLL